MKESRSSIVIKHEIEVDNCLVEEILNLNNVHNILTLYCCCGHKNPEEAFIVVQDDCLDKMLELEYETNYTHGSIGYYTEKADEIPITNENKYLIKDIGRWYLAFKPKSICKCKD